MIAGCIAERHLDFDGPFRDWSLRHRAGSRLVKPRRADLLLTLVARTGFRVDQIRFLQDLDIVASRLRHPKRSADLVDVKRSATTQQPQDSHTNGEASPRTISNCVSRMTLRKLRMPLFDGGSLRPDERRVFFPPTGSDCGRAFLGSVLCKTAGPPAYRLNHRSVRGEMNHIP